MFFTKFVSIALAMLVCKANSTPITSPIEGYSIGEFTWEVETFPGGPKKNITGTVENVVAELSTINPNWKDDFKFDESRIKNRGVSFPFTAVLCNIRTSEWGLASVPRISEGIDYLNGVPGTPVAGPGPSACARVSCSYDSAIYWCNDAPQTFSLPGFSTIAAGALTILNNCAEIAYPNMNGQVFAQFLQNWNTIVRGDSC
ncbi:hypothetical protein BX600DRAFT_441555 [Xylariales sp. PMI_506]|nr:hypothetical protein BX600DRAFT_441555 [Xylariales sp. PMI_506]